LLPPHALIFSTIALFLNRILFDVISPPPPPPPLPPNALTLFYTPPFIPSYLPFLSFFLSLCFHFEEKWAAPIFTGKKDYQDAG
jgi:hypothetical protein